MPGAANRSVERTKGVNTPSRSAASPAASQHQVTLSSMPNPHQGLWTHIQMACGIPNAS